VLEKKTVNLGGFRESVMSAMDKSSDIGVNYMGGKKVVYGRVSTIGFDSFVLIGKDDEKPISISFDEVLDIY